MNRLLIAFTLAGCTATVRTAGPPPNEPAPPPPQPVYTAPAPAPAPAPVVTAPPPAGSHSAYSAALRNLRYARALVERSGGGGQDVKFDEKYALNHIEVAINEAKAARADDGQPMSEHPPIEARLVYRDRLREAARVLGDAEKDLLEREDNLWAHKDRNTAIQHIRLAEKAINDAIGERHSEAQPPAAPPPVAAAHPAYMTALGNLRQARALLERPAGAADVKWDEHTALKDIDEAFEEIRKARVDDGKPMTEHPPIESGLVYRDRLKEAEKQLHEAGQDLDSREDNFWAKKDRRRAVDAIRRAEKATHEAMADRKEDKAEKKEEKREEKADKKAAKGH